jgi:hypothetical protein
MGLALGVDCRAVLGWIVALAALLALPGCARVGGEAFQPTYSAALPLHASVGQTFRPATDAIAGIDLFTVTYAQPADPRGVLTVTLRDGLGGRQLASATLGGRQIADNRWARARFNPPVPAPQVAAVMVGWDGATPVGLQANIPPPEYDPVQQDANDPYPGGELIWNGVRAQGDLAFRVVGSGDPDELARQLGGILRSAGGRLLRDERSFTLGWLALLASSAALAVTGLRRRPSEFGNRRHREQHGERQESGAEYPGDL